ncbi:MAG: DUF5320 domain-containing protein [Chloroflexota bacterium]
MYHSDEKHHEGDCCWSGWRHWHWGPWGFGGLGFGRFGFGPRFRRWYWSRDEEIAWLEEYLKDLQAEVKGVEERIKELKAR